MGKVLLIEPDYRSKFPPLGLMRLSTYHEKMRGDRVVFARGKQPHLLDDKWDRNCRGFGFTPVLCSSKHGKWQIEVKSRIQDFNLGTTRSICILAVHMTAASPRFHNAVARLKPDHTMLIGDEAHGLGSPQLDTQFPV